MGYTTSFKGQFSIAPMLRPEHLAYLKAFNYTRRMKRDPAVVAGMPDARREAVGLPVGPDGAYYVGSADDGNFGQGTPGEKMGAVGGIVASGSPPSGQPGLWCQWTPTDDGMTLKWDEGEKFYKYVEWLEYLIKNFLGPWGYTLNGVVKWKGEEQEDRGRIVVEDNVVRTDT
jgi:hypothetical protein